MANSTFRKPTALFLADVCEQTYAQFSTPQGWFTLPPTYRLLGTFTGGPLQTRQEPFGFVIESPTAAVAAFRGTASLAEWLSDADLAQAKWPYGPGSVHRGFLRVYQSLRSELRALLAQLPLSKPLFMTGHSLGGALASLALFDDAVHVPEREWLIGYTFATPRVGNPRWAEAFTQVVPYYVRIANPFDSVTHLPTPQLRDVSYRHATAAHRVPFRTGTVQGNHALSGYRAALE